MNNLLELPGLLILDVQKGFDDSYWGTRNNPEAEGNMARLLTEWRNRKGHVIYTKHLSLDPASPLHHRNKLGTEFKEIIQPMDGEIVFTKNVNSGFIGTELEAYLKQKQIKSVVITGLSTQHCVSTTTRMSGNLGFNTFLVSDAIAAFEITDHKGVRHTAASIQENELAMLQKEFATIITTNEIISQFKQQ
ncbi:cysteine hydrolase family protein [Mesobacillus selenatarsenatis]|uniref:Isochorismatase n=1 Tax=Mesobacillus selenatarsenatis (strain DSM 18680 / JCM 14380 / FERM P-15431 / SF-1) TaxID=1321606 RepID=A0A0A8X616_MESS1|nr:isochorismatase family protein [Mesobacillus selenatarsenatis]GAM14724.1 isochorismatase [Mesobacillus selenatarsenatis SF-1]